MFNQMIDWVSGSNWSYLAILGVAILDAFFPFVPSESIVIVAGTLAGAGDLNVFLVILVRLGRCRDRRQHLVRDRQVRRRADGEAAVPPRESA